MENKKQKLSSALMLEGIRAWEISIKPAWHKHRGLVQGLGASLPHCPRCCGATSPFCLRSFSCATKGVSAWKALSGLWYTRERLHPTLLRKHCCRGTFLTGQPSGGFTAPLSAFRLRFKRREKHHFPGASSLATLLQYQSSDKWAWQQFMGVWCLKQCHCSQLTTYMLSDDRSISKPAFPYMAVPIQTHHINSCNQLSKSIAKPPCFISP